LLPFFGGDRPLFAFAGIWITFNGDRGTKSKPIPGPHQVYGFLTTAPNAVVKPIHSNFSGVASADDNLNAVAREQASKTRAHFAGSDNCDNHGFLRIFFPKSTSTYLRERKAAPSRTERGPSIIFAAV
jgi:hypothetical protein